MDASDRPIKFDALVGDAIIRDKNGSVSAYNAIPIQADSALATGALITPGSGPGGYATVSGDIQSSVRFDQAGSSTNPSVTTTLTLLTLNVLPNRPNFPTFVDLNFFNANAIQLSTSTDFTCWTEVTLSTLNGSTNSIDPNLTKGRMGTFKGFVESTTAAKVAVGGITDTAGPVTLLGIVTTSVKKHGARLMRTATRCITTPTPFRSHFRFHDATEE